MAEILGLGLSHFGGFMFPDEDMASRVRARLDDGSLPSSLDHPSKWPAPMRAEWGEDAGQHELLIWYPLLGAMHALGQRPDYCELLESHLMNSSKCVAVIPPGKEFVS